MLASVSLPSSSPPSKVESSCYHVLRAPHQRTATRSVPRPYILAGTKAPPSGDNKKAEQGDQGNNKSAHLDRPVWRLSPIKLNNSEGFQMLQLPNVKSAHERNIAHLLAAGDSLRRRYHDSGIKTSSWIVGHRITREILGTTSVFVRAMGSVAVQRARKSSKELERIETRINHLLERDTPTCPELGSKETEKYRHNPFLEGNFEPVESEQREEIECEVIGQLPKDLEGVFMRNGPNPRFAPDKGSYHWFDGDGLVHCVRFSNSTALYSSHFVRTTGYKEEEAARVSLFSGLAAPPGAASLCTFAKNLLSLRQQDAPLWNGVKNPANNALVWHAGKLLALWEAGLPYELNPVGMGTKGISHVANHGSSPRVGFTAHPKVDPITRELMYFGYNLVHAPFLQYGVLSPEGKLSHSADIHLQHPVMMHDFAITQHHTLFLNFPFRFRMAAVMQSLGTEKPFAFHQDVAGRIGVLPRYGQNEDIRWFQVSTGFCLHVLNAYEQQVDLNGQASSNSSMDKMSTDAAAETQTEIVLQAFRFNTFSALGLAEAVSSSSSSACGPSSNAPPEICRLHEYRLNLTTGEVTESPLCEVCSDFPAMNLTYVGRKNRFGYSSRFCSQPGPGQGAPLFDALLKHDLATGAVQAHEFGRERLGGEAVFAPALQRDAAEGSHRYTSTDGAFVSERRGALERGQMRGKRQGGSFEEAGEDARCSGDGIRGTSSEDEEDEGYLLVHVWDEEVQRSEVLVLDAKQMEDPPVARVMMPFRVPFGFHGAFVPASGPTTEQ